MRLHANCSVCGAHTIIAATGELRIKQQLRYLLRRTTASADAVLYIRSTEFQGFAVPNTTNHCVVLLFGWWLQFKRLNLGYATV